MAASTPHTIAFAIRGPISRTDLAGLCDRVCALLERTRPDVALCDVATVDADAVTVDALARLQLGAQRHGCQVRLRNASPELCELLAFLGLRDVLPE
jgi:ABC-type transporter Mla MlaB component